MRDFDWFIFMVLFLQLHNCYWFDDIIDKLVEFKADLIWNVENLYDWCLQFGYSFDLVVEWISLRIARVIHDKRGDCCVRLCNFYTAIIWTSRIWTLWLEYLLISYIYEHLLWPIFLHFFILCYIYWFYYSFHGIWTTVSLQFIAFWLVRYFIRSFYVVINVVQ